MHNNSFNFFLLDTFSKELFRGNPTPVCILNSQLPVEQMHQLAQEFSMPVAVFLCSEGAGQYSIRYFTVKGEIPACGHGTLGAAHVVLEKSKENDEVQFSTIEGINLKASKDGMVTYVEYPKFQEVEINIPSSLFKAVGIRFCKSHFYCTELQTIFLELETAEEVRKVKPDFKKLVDSMDIKELVVMSEADQPEYDFILRSFCPWIGIDEDPVTGSIHSVLGHYWKERLQKDVLIAYQASERGGQIMVKPMSSSVKIGGYCRKIVEGYMQTIEN